MNREELIKLLQSWLTTATDDNGNPIHVIMDVDIHEIATEIIESSLPPAEGAEANRASIDDLIKKHIPIDAANFEYCAKHNIINGGLLQGIRDVVNSFMKPQPTAEGAETILHRHIDKQSMDELSVNVWPDILEAMQEFAAQQQPTAEGAEEMDARTYLDEWMRQHNYRSNKLIGWSEAVDFADDFATLHAQRIAEKMVSERLREELFKFFEYEHAYTPKYLNSGHVITEYLKTRESND